MVYRPATIADVVYDVQYNEHEYVLANSGTGRLDLSRVRVVNYVPISDESQVARVTVENAEGRRTRVLLRHLNLVLDPPSQRPNVSVTDISDALGCRLGIVEAL